MDYLDDLELRLALAGQSRLLTGLLAANLVKLLSFLDHDAPVGSKALEIVNHIHRRVKTVHDVKIPVRDILDSPELRTGKAKLIASMYIENGLKRLSKDEQVELLPALIARGLQHAAVEVMGMVTESNYKTLDPRDFPITIFPTLRDFLAVTEAIYLDTASPLLSVNAIRILHSKAIDLTSAKVWFMRRGVKALGKRISLNLSFVGHVQIGIITFLEWYYGHATLTSEQLNEIYACLLVGTCDSRSLVVGRAEAMERQVRRRINADDRHLLALLFKIYLGDSLSQKPRDEHFREQAPSKLKFRIVDIFLTSTTVHLFFQPLLKVVFDSTSLTGSGLKLRLRGWLLFRSMVQRASIEKVAPMLLQAVCRGLECETGSEEIRSLLYSMLPVLGEKAPSTLHIGIFKELFDRLEREPPSVRLSVSEALSRMKVPDHINKAELGTVIVENASKDKHQSRYMAVKYATSLGLKAVGLRLIEDPHHQVREEARKCLYQGQPSLPDFNKLVASISGSPNPSMLTFLRNLLVGTILKKPGYAYEERLAELTINDHKALSAHFGSFRDGEGATSDLDVSAYSEKVHSLVFARNLPQHSAVPSLCYSELCQWRALPHSLIDPVKLKQTIWAVGTNLEATVSLARSLAAISTDPQFSDAVTTDVERDLQDSLDQIKLKGVGSGIGHKFITWAAFARCRPRVFPVLLNEGAVEYLRDTITGAATHHSVIEALICLRELLLGGIGDLDLDHLVRLIKRSQHDTTLIELSMKVLSLLALRNATTRSKALEFLFSLGTSHHKDVELHFCVGESLVNIGLGSDSPFLQKESLVAPLVCDKSHTDLEDIAEKALRLTGHSTCRKAASVWLLYLVEHASSRLNLRRFHQALLHLLSDRDELTQEIASNGLSILYDKCEPALKQEMVSSLASALVDGRRPTQTIDKDSHLFEEGELGKTPGKEGQAITTYKSILSLAADLNQPDLVYKFMSLANHNAIWSSRRGAAFGLSGLIRKAKVDLEPLVSGMIPKLFRYQFDPNPKVADSMRHLWSCLVPDDSTAIDKNFDAVSEELVGLMEDGQWRIRESSCLALNDIVPRNMMRLLQHSETILEKLFRSAFRVMDDIKESVRAAAERLARTLSTQIVRYLEPTAQFTGVERRKASMVVAGVVVPFFLHQGLESGASEVRRFSIKTLVQICNQADMAVLKGANLPLLTTRLLGSLDVLEPQAANYVSLNAENYNINRDMLDVVRTEAVKHSKVMSALNRVIDYALVDQKELEAIAREVLRLFRSSLGVATQAGALRLLSVITIRSQKCGTILMKGLRGSLSDSRYSGAIRRNAAQVLATAAKHAPAESISNCLRDLWSTYFREDGNQEDGTTKSVIAVAVTGLLRNSKDNGGLCADEAAIMAYVCQWDDDKAIMETWKDAWEDLVVGSAKDSIIGSHFVSVILPLARELASSNKWNRKRASARLLKHSFSRIASDGPDKTKFDGCTPSAVAADVLVILEKEALGRRLWEGREEVLGAMVSIVTTGVARDPGTEHTDLVLRIRRLLIKESMKKDLGYRAVAISSLIRFLDHFEDVDASQDVQAIASESLNCSDRSTMSESDGDEQSSRFKGKLKIQNLEEQAVLLLGSGFPSKLHEKSQDSRFDTFVAILCDHAFANVWSVRIAAASSLAKIVARTKHLEKQDLSKVYNASLGAVGDIKNSKFRAMGFKISRLLLESPVKEQAREHVGEELRAIAREESNPLARHEAEQVLDLLK